MSALMTEVRWDVERLADDLDAADQAIRDGCERVRAVGDHAAILNAFRARSAAAIGRPTNLRELRSLARDQWGYPRALLHGAAAVVLLARRRVTDAEQEARSAVEFFAAGEFLLFHADHLLILGDVLRAAGKSTQATGAFREARDVYRRKGSLVGGALAVRKLAGSA
jgi:hypothetical protein